MKINNETRDMLDERLLNSNNKIEKKILMTLRPMHLKRHYELELV